MNKPQILIIEDDNAIGNLISTTLETQHYQYRRAKNGASGVLEAASCRPDVILLDLGLPDMDGVDIIKKVRTWSNTPIIVISARSEDHDKVEALDAGADDYLTKPFNILELKARIRALLRRAGSTGKQQADVLACDHISIDRSARNAYNDGRLVDLTQKEFDLVELLMRNPNRVYSREALLDAIWGYDNSSDIRTVDVHIRRLREKLERTPASPEHIMTKWGVGYYFKF